MFYASRSEMNGFLKGMEMNVERFKVLVCYYLSGIDLRRGQVMMRKINNFRKKKRIKI